MITNKESRDGLAGVVRLSDAKARRRRDTLLMTRRSIAIATAEHRSHALEDAAALWALQLQLEQTIQDEFPVVYEQQFALWALEECSYEHPVGMLTFGCSLCEAIAAEAQINLEPPYAA
ncbi:hypothetical protein [Aeromicrobium sp. Leaf245]|uniref:hypothetical protein n=1 Tax=Aeromicrobium sp. Leaf245 TaxID=1736306 RepID=UPI0012E2B150|nr:hypothetical protein [Aeromicrobium sp. Leaf245]